MLQLGGTISTQEVAIHGLVRKALTTRKIEAITAADVPGTGDYLQKIIDLIRGSGFGIAIFSDLTPARTLANIFFELGVAGILGKPVQLIIAGASPAPSDFVRTEWIRYDEAHESRFVAELGRSLHKIEEGADYYQKIGQLALDAEEPDLEEAFERFKQAVLISNDDKARAALLRLRDRLRRIGRSFSPSVRDLASHRSRLLRAVNEFITLLPNVSGRRRRAPK
jgi:hypothetical protein